MFTKNPWIACIILLWATTGTFTAAGPAPQSPAQGGGQALTEEERLKALQKLLQDMQKNPQGQPAQTQPPATTPSGTPNIVQRAPLQSGMVSLNYLNADLSEFINTTCDTLSISPIMIDPDVKGSVTIHSMTGTGISKQDMLAIFNLVLKNNNAALVKSGTIYQIVPISQGLRQGLEVVLDLPPAPPAKPAPDKDTTKKQEVAPGGPEKPPATPVTGAQPPAAKTATVPPLVTPALPAGAAAATQAQVQTPPAQPITPAVPQRQAGSEVPRLATHVIRVEFVPVTTLLDPIKLFMTEGGVIMPYERLNMLIVTDYSDSIAKILDIIRLLDSSYLDAELIELVEIKYNASADVLEDLKKIFGSGKDTATGVYMVSLDRINTIMVMANSKRAMEEVKRWIARLDSTTGRSVQTFIYTVENATASNIAMVLSLLFGGGDSSGAGMSQQGGTGAGGVFGGPSSAAQGAVSPMGTAGRGTTGGRSQSSMGMNQGGFTGGGSMFGGGQSYGGQNVYGMGAGMGGGQVGGPRFNQGSGMSAQWLNGGSFVGLQGMVRLVADDINNALIIQASSADYQYLLDTIKRMDVLPRQVIIDARIFEIDLTDDLAFGVSAALQAQTPGQHLTTGAISATTGALTAGTFALIGNSREILINIDALRQKTKVRVLEAPAVLALDGTPARINVGGSVPVPTQSYVTTGGAATGVSYRDTGTSLMITPRISASGTVTLNVYYELSSPGAETPNGPSFTQTNAETTLAVKDGESVAIAGLIRESESNSRSGVPFLSEIPVLGALFGRTSRNAMRSELLIMITPHVIRTPERFREMTEEIKDSLRNVRKYADDKLKEIMDDKEKAAKERIQQQEKAIKKEEPPVPVKK
jgi:general secretion pathway protein D